MTAKMSSPIDNLDLLEELYNFIKDPESDLESTVKAFSGQTYYIPSYKTTFRNEKIIDDYRKNYGQVGLVKRLSRAYNLTERQIYDITKGVRATPSLFY